ncbi:MAG: hypothetical protein ACKVT0_21470 [Planctomycetaceae bacterium]
MTATTNQSQVDTPNLTETIGDESTCILKLAAMWQAADILPAYPATTETVVELLRANGFDASIGILENWIRSGMVPGVQIRAGRFHWSAQNILTASIHCNTWKRWIPLHPKHIHKMSAIELAEAQAGKVGETAFTDLDTFDVQAFTVMIERCDDHQLRHVLAVGLRSKLKALGVLDS